MPKCHKCHGAGFTMHQVGWSMGRVRILCKTCAGIGYIYRKIMTPEQSKQAAAIMQKHGEEGWRIEFRDVMTREWRSLDDVGWDWIGKRYRAVRIDRTPTRTPLPIEHYKVGMVILSGASDLEWLIAAVDKNILACRRSGNSDFAASRWFDWQCVLSWRWPNETEWHPAFTETVEEKIVQTLIVEGL